MKKKLLAILICIVIVLSTLACLLLIPNSKLLDIFGKSIKVGIADDRPFSYISSDGTPTGFSSDVATKIFEALDYKVKFVTIDWNDRENLLKRGKIDCYMDSTGVLSDDFVSSKYYFAMIQGSFYNKNKNIELNSPEDLRNYACAYINGTSSADFLSENNAMLSIGYESAEAAADAVIQGKADICIAGLYHIERLAAKEKFKDFSSGILLFNEDHKIAFRAKDSELKDVVDKQIEDMLSNGGIKLLIKHYALLNYTA